MASRKNGRTNDIEFEMMAELFSSVISFLRISGWQWDEIVRAVDVAKDVSLSSRRSKLMLVGNSEWAVIAMAIYRWHQDERLLDANARPRPLKLTGETDSIENLLAAEGAGQASASLARLAKSCGLLSRDALGKYRPKNRVATIRALSPMTFAHTARSVHRLLSTVHANTKKLADGPPLIERYTMVPDFAAEDIEDFEKYAQKSGTAFLARLDDWLEARRVPRKKEKSTSLEVGVQVIAYASSRDSLREKSPKRSTRPSKPVAKSSRRSSSAGLT